MSRLRTRRGGGADVGALSTANVDGVAERIRCGNGVDENLSSCGEWFDPPRITLGNGSGSWLWDDGLYASCYVRGRCESCSRSVAEALADAPWWSQQRAGVGRWTAEEWAALERTAPEYRAAARPVPNREVEPERRPDAEAT